jgi:hypothetical protein
VGTKPARSARPDQREQTNVLSTKQPTDLGKLDFAPYERRRWRGQVRPVERPERGELPLAELVPAGAGRDRPAAVRLWRRGAPVSRADAYRSTPLARRAAGDVRGGHAGRRTGTATQRQRSAPDPDARGRGADPAGPEHGREYQAPRRHPPGPSMGAAPLLTGPAAIAGGLASLVSLGTGFKASHDARKKADERWQHRLVQLPGTPGGACGATSRAGGARGRTAPLLPAVTQAAEHPSPARLTPKRPSPTDSSAASLAAQERRLQPRLERAGAMRRTGPCCE